MLPRINYSRAPQPHTQGLRRGTNTSSTNTTIAHNIRSISPTTRRLLYAAALLCSCHSGPVTGAAARGCSASFGSDTQHGSGVVFYFGILLRKREPSGHSRGDWFSPCCLDCVRTRRVLARLAPQSMISPPITSTSVVKTGNRGWLTRHQARGRRYISTTGGHVPGRHVV